MSLSEIYNKYPTQDSCIAYLENIRWRGIPVCPICRHTKYSAVKDSHKYHCNLCNRSFTVTVKTIFHKSKVDLQKWFYVIGLIYSTRKISSVRVLGEEIGLTKDTVALMLKKIRNSSLEDRKLLESIIQ